MATLYHCYQEANTFIQQSLLVRQSHHEGTYLKPHDDTSGV